MNPPALTRNAPLAKSCAMTGSFKARWMMPQGKGNFLALLVASSMPLAGCISVSAPDKPIVIELNINIKQEVIYRLAADAGNTIDENAEIF